MKEVPPLLTSPFILISLDSPPMYERDPLGKISVFHFHLLEIIPPLAGIEEVILDMSQNDFSAFTGCQAPGSKPPSGSFTNF